MGTNQRLASVPLVVCVCFPPKVVINKWRLNPPSWAFTQPIQPMHRCLVFNPVPGRICLGRCFSVCIGLLFLIKEQQRLHTAVQPQVSSMDLAHTHAHEFYHRNENFHFGEAWQHFYFMAVTVSVRLVILFD